MDRRSLILGGACLIAAPAIVRYEWLMPVKVIDKLVPFWVMENGRIKQIVWTRPEYITINYIASKTSLSYREVIGHL